MVWLNGANVKPVEYGWQFGCFLIFNPFNRIVISLCLLNKESLDNDFFEML